MVGVAFLLQRACERLSIADCNIFLHIIIKLGLNSNTHSMRRTRAQIRSVFEAASLSCPEAPRPVHSTIIT